jgi:hypothetical protein
MERVDESACVPGVAWARAGNPVRTKQSLATRLRDWVRGDSTRCLDSWRRVATLEIGGASATLDCRTGDSYHFIKVTAVSVEVDVRRLTLEFRDGSLHDLSIGWLLRGTESRPMSIGGRELKGVVMEYKVRPGKRGAVEIWAHN